jgi:purine-binding chemotaxis protein CheW
MPGGKSLVKPIGQDHRTDLDAFPTGDTFAHIDVTWLALHSHCEIAGLANLRGRIVTMLRLDRCLWLDAAVPSDESRLAVGVQHNGEDYALLIDATEDVVTVRDDARMECPTHIDPRLRDLLSGCYREDPGFLSILDLGALLRRVNRSSEQTPGASRRGVSLKGAGK